MDDDLIIFEPIDNNERIRLMEKTIEILTSRLDSALGEIASLQQQLMDHVNFFHDTERPTRFHITHIPKNIDYSDGSSSDSSIIINV